MTDPNHSESHAIGIFGLFKIVATVLISLLAIMGILLVASIIDKEMFTAYAIKFLMIAGIILAAGGLISLLAKLKG